MRHPPPFTKNGIGAFYVIQRDFGAFERSTTFDNRATLRGIVTFVGETGEDDSGSFPVDD